MMAEIHRHKSIRLRSEEGLKELSDNSVNTSDDSMHKLLFDHCTCGTLERMGTCMGKSLSGVIIQGRYRAEGKQTLVIIGKRTFFQARAAKAAYPYKAHRHT